MKRRKEKNFKRKCPKCNNTIWYTLEKTRNIAEKKESICQSCNKKGDKNGFYGKTHSKESKESISLNVKNMDRSYMQSNEYKDIMKKVSEENYKPYYDIWVDKYGVEEADKKLKKLKHKQSINSTGSNNSMYGKPSPQGSSNGWSGWYKGKFFRSLKELKYMIELEENNIVWEKGEIKKYQIKYKDYDGIEKNYYPDFFLIKEKILIECKPKHLHNSKNVILKKEAALKWCKEKGYTYKMIDPGKIKNEI